MKYAGRPPELASEHQDAAGDDEMHLVALGREALVHDA
jgi:hypothetical protein